VKVGDLVRDTDRGDFGLVIAVDKTGKNLVKVAFSDETEWFSRTYLEVINGSR
tara:strand:+ start:204 stop:362 length:159 start_codon:yes stop_codon:yes gene_type:complete